VCVVALARVQAACSEALRKGRGVKKLKGVGGNSRAPKFIFTPAKYEI